jgi:Phage gp6-like head-tail connector protein
MTYDLGDVIPLGITITDSTGANANASAVTCTITLPDGTTSTGSVTNPSTGLYNCDFSPTQTGRHAVRWLATGTNASAYTDEFTVRDYADLGIVGLDEVKAHLNIPTTDTTLDEELRRFIDAATDLAETYVGQVLGRRTFTSELYDGGTAFIRIRNPKAISITSVTENGLAVSSSAYVLDYTGQRLYRIGSGTLYATNSYGYWVQGMNNISITYVAGYVNPPMAARQGVLEIIRHLWQTQRGSMSVMGRSLGGDELYTTPTYSLPRRAMELLDPTSFPGIA